MAVPNKQRTAFTLLETLAAVAIIAVLLAVMVPQVANFVAEGQRQSDMRTLATLNDAVNRYKTQGGDLSILDTATPKNQIVAALKTPISWQGLTHNLLNAGVTFSSSKIDVAGYRKTFRFTRYDTYTSESFSTFAPGETSTAITIFAGNGTSATPTIGASKLNTGFGSISYIQQIGSETYFSQGYTYRIDAAGVIQLVSSTLRLIGYLGGYYYFEPCTGSQTPIWRGTAPDGSDATHFAFSGTQGTTDGAKETAQRLNGFTSRLLAADGAGNIYFADLGDINPRVRRINISSGRVETLATGNTWQENPGSAQTFGYQMGNSGQAVYDASSNSMYYFATSAGLQRLNLNTNTLSTPITVNGWPHSGGGLVLMNGSLYFTGNREAPSNGPILYKAAVGSGTKTAIAGNGAPFAGNYGVISTNAPIPQIHFFFPAENGSFFATTTTPYILKISPN